MASHQKTQFPLFTQRHVHHSSVWSLKGFTVPTLCLACATERLEDKAELSLHHRRVLGELQGLLANKDSCLIHMLSSDRRVLDHLSTTVFGLLVTQDGGIAQLAMEVLSLISGQFSATELPRKLMHKTVQTVMTTQSCSGGLPYLTFLGRLLHSLPSLCTEMTNSFGGFLEYLLRGLAYPDEDVKSAVVYILAQLSMKTPQNSLPGSLVQGVCGFISSNLASAKSHTLTLNLLGLVKGMLKSSVYAQCLLQTDRHTSNAKGSTLASAFKRVLLSNDETLQLSGVQCVSEVLTHQPQYGETLLKADIAEFMFEALRSRKNSLMLSLFSCLTQLATVEDFYSKGHMVYGIDQVIEGVSASLETKNYKAVNLGLTFLSTFLKRQPAMLSLFTSATSASLQKLLVLLHTALQISVTTLPAIATLSDLLCPHHLPSGFPLSTLLPLLSLLLHLLELHVSTHTDDRGLTTQQNDSAVAIHPLQLLCSVLSAMENMHKVCLEGKRSSGEKCAASEDVMAFLSISFEENLVPALLLKADVLDRCEAFSAFFNITRIQLGLAESSNADLALKLGSLGLIHFAFDIKSRFVNAPDGVSLCGCINECVESLCASLEPDSQKRAHIREILHSALPNINCELEKSLEFLIQRPSAGSSSGSTGSLLQLQRAVLTLFYLSAVHSSASVTSPVLVLQALDRFLILNSDIHLMPAISLAHLTTLYAVTVQEAGVKISTKASQGNQIIVRALLRVASPSTVFSANPHLLQWAFSQPLLQGIARTWFWEWFKFTCTKDDSGNNLGPIGCEGWSTILQFIRTTPTAFDILLDVSSEEELTPPMLSFLDNLLSEQCVDSNSSQKVFGYLQKVLLAQRIHPLSEGATASLMNLLAKSIHSTSVTPDLKLVYHATSFVTRCCSEFIASGIALLCEVLSDSKEVNSQVLGLLHNNTSFLERVVSCVPLSSKPKDHSILSANALRIIASLIYHQHKTKISCSQSGGVLSLQATLATLIHHSPTINLSGLYFWRVVLSAGGYTGSFALCDSNRRVYLCHNEHLVKKLCFILQNCLLKDHQAVRKACSVCLVELFKYISTSGAETLQQEIGYTWNRAIIDHISTVSVNTHIPVYYLPCLEAIICKTPLTHSTQLKEIAQLLYESAVNAYNSTDTTLVKYASCLREVKRIDKTLLDANQWTHLNKLVPQIN